MNSGNAVLGQVAARVVPSEFWVLSDVSDGALLDGVRSLIRSERKMTARLLAHLNEVEERRLHWRHAVTSMFAYCVERLGMSEDEAGRRIAAARLAKSFPSLYSLLDGNKISLSVLLLLKPYLTEQNQAELFAGVSGLSRNQAEAWLAARFPKPDVPDIVRKLLNRERNVGAPVTNDVGSETSALDPASAPNLPALAQVQGETVGERGAGERVAEREPIERERAAERGVGLPLRDGTRVERDREGAAPSDEARSARRRDVIQPLSCDRYKVQFTADQKLKEKLELARELLAHAHPAGDLSTIIERALDLLIADRMRQRFGQTTRPRRSRGPSATGEHQRNRAHVTHETRRLLIERDGLGCSYVDESGERCGAVARLEFDHIVPHARGGPPTVENLRLRCRAHNRLAAELEFGREHVRKRIGARISRERSSPTRAASVR
jgi:5-methylcytosine-specific restriction endonuclease McrA